MDVTVLLCAVLLGTALAAFHPDMKSIASTESVEYAEYEQSLYCDALRCIGSNGQPLKMGSIVRADVCGSFCLCTDEKVVRFDCPANLYFNEATGQCDFPQLAQCRPEFLTREALELYIQFNPDKMRNQSHDVEQWQRMWQCVDSYKKNETMPNELSPTDAKLTKAPVPKKANEPDLTSHNSLSTPVPKMEQQIINSTKTSIGSNSQKSNIPQTKYFDQTVTDNKPLPGSTTSFSNEAMLPLKLSNPVKGAPQKKPVTFNDSHRSDSSSAEIQQFKITQNDTSEKGGQPNVKRESSDSSMIDNKGSEATSASTLSSPLSRLQNSSQSDSSDAINNTSLSINGATKSTKSQTTDVLQKGSEKVDLDLVSKAGVANQQIKAREGISKNSSSKSNSGHIQISRPKNETFADAKAERNDEPAVVSKQEKNLTKAPALAKSRFSIVRDKLNGTSSLLQDNFFATVIKLANKFQAPSQNNSYSLNKTHNSSNADNKCANSTNISQDVPVREKMSPNKPESNSSTKKKESAKNQDNLVMLNQTKEFEEKKELSIKANENARNLTAPARLPDTKSRKTPVNTAIQSKTRLAVQEQKHTKQRTLSSIKNTTNVKTQVTAEAQNLNLPDTARLLKPKSDASRNNSNTTINQTKDAHKSKSLTESSEKELERSQNIVSVNQNKTESIKNIKPETHNDSTPLTRNSKTSDIPQKTLATTKHPTKALKETTYAALINPAISKKIVNSNQNASIIEQAQIIKNNTVEPRNLETQAKVLGNKLGTRQQSKDSTPSQNKGQTPVANKKSITSSNVTAQATYSSVRIVNKTKDVLVGAHNNVTAKEDVSTSEIHAKVSKPKIVNLKLGNDENPKIGQKSSRMECPQKSIDENIESIPITVNQAVSMRQLPQKPNMIGIKYDAPKEAKKSHETSASTEVERPADADLKLNEDGSTAKVQAESKSKAALSENTTKIPFQVPAVVALNKKLPVEPFQDTLKARKNTGAVVANSPQSNESSALNEKKSECSAPENDTRSEMPLQSAIEDKQLLRGGQKSFTSPYDIDSEKANAVMNKETNSASGEAAMEFKVNVSPKPANQKLKTKENNNAAAEVKVVEASSATRLPAEEFNNKEEENTGELLMKLRKALQDVYEKAASSNPQRTNHEHLTFKKRVRLLRNKRKSRDAARRGKLHRLRRQILQQSHIDK